MRVLGLLLGYAFAASVVVSAVVLAFACVAWPWALLLWLVLR